MEAATAPARTLFRAALLIFVVTILIGILNGAGLWSPPHNLAMTHVHAGTLGWITLAVIAAAVIALVSGPNDAAATRTMATVAIAATLAYVGAFAATSGIVRPIAGTLMLVAIVWVLIWAWGRYQASSKSPGQLGLFLALVSLTIGGIQGVLLGLFIARGGIPGMSTDTAIAIAGAHPPAMLIGYLILAGAAVCHFVLDGPSTKPGRLVMWGLFVAGLVANASFVFRIDDLIPVATLLEVIAIIVLLVHLRSRLAPSAWRGGGAENFARIGTIFLGVGVILLVYVVQLLVSGQLDPAAGTGPMGALLAFDHAMFIGVMTNALFALIARTSGIGANPVTIWGVNIALAIFLVGLVADVGVLIQIGAPLMGLLLLHAVAIFTMRLGAKPQTAS